ncbi:MAG: dTDP-4-dehydrorhamnose 3,5-epimerase [Bacteroidales bacterium]|nr:dTDP-4-dehydrorhamnose 3,5-epimerase [Bacteroidales bacterium]
MTISPTGFEGLWLITPKVFNDIRGYFMEVFRKETFSEKGIEAQFHQDNESCSAKGVLRGLHFQHPPYEQGKLVRVVAGRVLDVAVDIRTKSATYGRWYSVVLDSSEKKMLYIPPGFAHGFLTLENDTIFQYKCTNPFRSEAEGCIRWNDPDIAIDWGVDAPQVSERDSRAPFFRDISNPF